MSVGASALAAAQTKIGQPYVLGARIGSGAWDCGSLVSWAYGQQGVSVPRYVPYIAAQLGASKKWQRVSGGLANAQAGDIVIPYPTLAHVVMAVGDGTTIIEAPHPGADVRKVGYNWDRYPNPALIFHYVGDGTPTATAMPAATVAAPTPAGAPAVASTGSSSPKSGTSATGGLVSNRPGGIEGYVYEAAVWSGVLILGAALVIVGAHATANAVAT